MEKAKYNYTPVSKDKLIEDLLENPFLNNFFLQHDLDSDTIERYLLELMSFNKEKKACLECKVLNECRLTNRGLEPQISYLDGKIMYSYKECKFLRVVKRKESQMGHIDAMHLPRSILQASMDQFDYDRGENKQLIYNKFVNFITKYKNGDTVKGMYLWGKYSVGKTYCLSALANELMKNSVDVIIAYYPDLVREFKSRISTNTLEEVVSKLKQIDVLMLDDIGAENNSPWVRDEILGPIIQFRLLDEKPTFFSSNLSYKDLSESHFSNTKTKVGTIRGYRIGVRIKDLVGEDNIIKM